MGTFLRRDAFHTFTVKHTAGIEKQKERHYPHNAQKVRISAHIPGKAADNDRERKNIFYIKLPDRPGDKIPGGHCKHIPRNILDGKNIKRNLDAENYIYKIIENLYVKAYNKELQWFFNRRLIAVYRMFWKKSADKNERRHTECIYSKSNCAEHSACVKIIYSEVAKHHKKLKTTLSYPMCNSAFHFLPLRDKIKIVIKQLPYAEAVIWQTSNNLPQ